MPELSIYMPVYNAGGFLKQAVESVLEQDFQDFEFYIHDDGSTDGSYDELLKYAAKDRRITLHKGVNGSSTDNMNQFIREANGKYIGFVDHDDYIDKSYFNDMINGLQKTGADVAVSSYTLIDSESKVLSWYTPTLTDGEVLDRSGICTRFLTSLDVEGFRWNKIYKKSAFVDNDIAFTYPFPGDIPAEFDLFACVDKAVMVGSRGYYYRQSSGSEVATMNPDKMRGFMSAYKSIGDKAQELGFVAEGRFYTAWRTVNDLFNNFKQRKRYSKQDWQKIKKEYNLKSWLGLNFFQAVSLVQKHCCKRDSKLKFFIKTLIVGIVYR